MWKKYFPALSDNQLTYLDSASTCQAPATVIHAISDYLQAGHASPDRGMHALSENADAIYQRTKRKLANWFNCQDQQLVYTRGTTESINIVANSLRDIIKPEQSILVTQMEHHSNLLPWQRLCQQTGARLNLLKITSDKELNISHLEQLLSDNCALVALTHCSNVLGTLNPVKQIISTARHYNVATMIDGTQAVAHLKPDLKQLDCDYYAFSGHKVYAPGGTGILYCKRPQSISPLLLGGGIVNRVTDNHFQLTSDISRLEAGSHDMCGIVALESAFNFIDMLGIDNISAHESKLMKQLKTEINQRDYTVISHPESQSILSLVSKQFHSHDIASVLASNNIATRAGHACAQPCLSALGYKHCVRVSVGLYNTEEDNMNFLNALDKVKYHLC